jgi:hypothetical protein
MEKREFRIVVIRIADGGGAGVGWSTPGLDKKKSSPSGGSYVRLLADGLDPRRCRYASVLPRLPHTRIEHHRPGPLREVSWNTQRQSGAAHIFSRCQLPSAAAAAALAARRVTRQGQHHLSPGKAWRAVGTELDAHA